MRVRVRVLGDSIDDFRSLRAWLREEPAVRRHGDPVVLPGDTPDTADDRQMGAGLDVLTLVLGSGLSAAQLVLSVIMWRASHGRPVRVIIEHDGRKVPVDTDDPDEAAAIAAKLEAD